MHKYILLDFVNGCKKMFGKKSNENSPQYQDPEFIVMESLSQKKKIQQLDMFVNQEKNSFAYNDIAKYIRKNWNNNEIKDYVEEITDYLVNVLPGPETVWNNGTDEVEINPPMKYWFFEFYPLIANGEQMILQLVSHKKLEGMELELLNGIYLMEPEILNQFYPAFLLCVSCTDSFNLWARSGAFYENIRIIEKLYLNGYNIFTNQNLATFWADSVNKHFAELILDRLK